MLISHRWPTFHQKFNKKDNEITYHRHLSSAMTFRQSNQLTRKSQFDNKKHKREKRMLIYRWNRVGKRSGIRQWDQCKWLRSSSDVRCSRWRCTDTGGRESPWRSGRCSCQVCFRSRASFCTARVSSTRPHLHVKSKAKRLTLLLFSLSIISSHHVKRVKKRKLVDVLIQLNQTDVDNLTTLQLWAFTRV
jgi:hypothetical protein